MNEANSASIAFLLKTCKRRVLAFSGGFISPEELFYNLMVDLVHSAVDDIRATDCWGECIGLIPDETLLDFHKWLERELVAVDYMPHPGAFVADFLNLADVEAKKHQLRPHFIHLCNLVKDRATSTSLDLAQNA